MAVDGASCVIYALFDTMRELANKEVVRPHADAKNFFFGSDGGNPSLI